MTSTLTVADRRRAALDRRAADAPAARSPRASSSPRRAAPTRKPAARSAANKSIGVRAHGVAGERPRSLRPVRAPVQPGKDLGPIATFVRSVRTAAGPKRKLGPPPGTFYVIASVVLVFVVLGLVMVLSASAVTQANIGNSPYAVFSKQAMWAGIGLVGMIFATQVPYTIWKPLTIPLLGLGAAAMAVPFVPGLGTPVNGARSWIQFAGLSVQPSEFLKLVVVIAAASLLTARAGELGDRRKTLYPIAALAGAAALMSIAQGDLGSAIVLGVIVLSVAWIAGVPMKPLAGLTLTAVIAAIGFVVSDSRRLSRFTAFMDIEGHKEFESYQVYQGLVSIANGGLTGSGIGGSRTKLGYLPYAHSDFIFSIIADELGMIGTAAVIGGFIVLVAFGIQAALAAPDRFGMLLAGGISAWFGVQAIINLGGVTGVMPVTGLTLPFFSAGGSSLFVSMFAAGLLLSVARRATRS
ncbi:MAG: cell division protein FtsW [Ilumatobacter sp.]|jgi:cell division protein FtsW